MDRNKLIKEKMKEIRGEKDELLRHFNDILVEIEEGLIEEALKNNKNLQIKVKELSVTP
jgi:hypothetical protein